MHGLFFISTMNGAAWGGSEELWFRTALHAASRAHEVHCAFYERPGRESRVAALEAAGVRVHLLPNPDRGPRSTRAWLRHRIARRQQRRALWALPLRADHVTVVNQGGCCEVAREPWRTFHRRLGAYALLFHNYEENLVLRPARVRALTAWTSRAAINLFAADRARVVLERVLGAPLRAGVLSNPITFEPPSAPEPYPESSSGPVRMVVLAALDVRRKAQDRLVEVLAAARWRERDWVLELHGAGPDEGLLRRLVEERDLRGRVRLMGHTDGVREVLSRAHLVLQLTAVDAMPLAVVEALAMARPVVVTAVGDMPLWVDGNGWVARDTTPHALDEALEAAWQQRRSWAARGRRSFEIFRNRYPPSPEVRLFEQVAAAVRGRAREES